MGKHELMFDDPALFADDDVGRSIPSRTTDPETSHAAFQSILVTASNQRGKLLLPYRYATDGLTDEEAQERSGVPVRSCWWKRCSELREVGLIVATGDVRKGQAGVERMVCVITPEGRAKLREIEQGTLFEWDSTP
jgi:hypothetical protein